MLRSEVVCVLWFVRGLGSGGSSCWLFIFISTWAYSPSRVPPRLVDVEAAQTGRAFSPAATAPDHRTCRHPHGPFSPRHCMTAAPAMLPACGNQEPYQKPEEGGRDAAGAGRRGPTVVRVPFRTGATPTRRIRPLHASSSLFCCVDSAVRRCTASARPSRRSRTF